MYRAPHIYFDKKISFITDSEYEKQKLSKQIAIKCKSTTNIAGY